MSVFIKTGFWKKFIDKKAPEGWFNLGKYIQDLISETPSTSGVESVTGDIVDNTDPKNPVVDRGYKVYTAYLRQIGTAEPSATVYQNHIGNIVWSKAGDGGAVVLRGTLTGAFEQFKTWANITLGFDNPRNYTVTIGPSSSNTIDIYIMNDDGNPTPYGAVINFYLEIRVYP